MEVDKIVLCKLQIYLLILLILYFNFGVCLEVKEIENSGENSRNKRSVYETSFEKKPSKDPFYAQEAGWDFLASTNESTWDALRALSLNTKNMLMDLGDSPPYLEGEGVKVAILDSGISWADPAFHAKGRKCEKLGDVGCRLLDEKVWFESNITYVKALCESHGTSVATVLGSSGIKFQGTAPKVKILDINIFDCNEKRYSEHLAMQAIRNATQRSIDVLVSSMALKTNPFLSIKRASAERLHDINGSEYLMTVPFKNEAQLAPFQSHHWAIHPRTFCVDSFHVEYHYFLTFKAPNLPIVECRAAFLTSHDSSIEIAHSQAFIVIVAPEEKGETHLDPSDMRHALEVQMKDAGKKALFLVCRKTVAFCNQAVLMATEFRLSPIFIAAADPLAWVHGLYEIQAPVIIVGPNNEKNIWNSFIVGISGYHEVKLKWRLSIAEYAFVDTTKSSEPHPALEVKPDILAIAGPFHVPSMGVDQGALTVESAPLANARFGGMLALCVEAFRQRGRSVTFKEMLARAQNTATPYGYSPGKIPPASKWDPLRDESQSHAGFAVSVAQQGAGLVNLQRMIETRVMAYPSKLELGYLSNSTQGLKKKVAIYFVNQGTEGVLYKVTHVLAVGLHTQPSLHQSFQPVQHFLKARAWSTKEQRFYVAPHQNHTLHFTFYLPPEATPEPFTLLSGYLKFQPVPSHKNWDWQQYGALHLPYLMMYGDRKLYPYLNQSQSDILRESDMLLKNSTTQQLHTGTQNLNFSMSGTDRPLWKVSFTFPVAHLTVYAYSITHRRYLGVIMEHTSLISADTPMYLPENTAMGWDGCYKTRKSRPNVCIFDAEVQFCLSVRLLGDEKLGIERSNRQECSPSFFITEK